MTDNEYEVRISRYFDAPPAMVYQAFVDPAQVAQWFGPLVFHVPPDTVDIDMRPGGRWNCTMVNTFDGSRAPMNTQLVEVVENQLIVGYDIAQGFPDVEDGTHIGLSIELTPEGDGTRLTLRQGMFPAAMRDAAQTGWNQSLFKLAALMATPAHFRTRPGSTTA